MSFADLPTETDLHELVEAALACLPIAWPGMVVNGQLHEHNPDMVDDLCAVFAGSERGYVEAQLSGRAGFGSPLPGPRASKGAVLTGAAFERAYRRREHRTMFVMAPLLGRDRRAGLVVVQIEEATRGGATATDHWVLMTREGGGAWTRRPIPKEVKERQYLTEHTGG